MRLDGEHGFGKPVRAPGPRVLSCLGAWGGSSSSSTASRVRGAACLLPARRPCLLWHAPLSHLFSRCVIVQHCTKAGGPRVAL